MTARVWAQRCGVFLILASAVLSVRGDPQASSSLLPARALRSRIHARHDGKDCARSLGLSNTATLRLRGGMMIYKDIISGDEMVSDSFPIEVVNDVVLKVETKMVVKEALNVNVGGNPSADGGEDEGVDDTAQRVNDVVDAFNLQVWGLGSRGWGKGGLGNESDRVENGVWGLGVSG
jgi:hypothetical protein